MAMLAWLDPRRRPGAALCAPAALRRAPGRPGARGQGNDGRGRGPAPGAGRAADRTCWGSSSPERGWSPP